MSRSLDACVEHSGHPCEEEAQTAKWLRAKGFSIEHLDFGSACKGFTP